MKQKRLLFAATLLLFQIQTLYARENPFAPVNQYGGVPLTKPLPAPDFQQEILPVIKAAKCRAEEPQEKNTTQQQKQVWKAKTVKPVKKKKKPILFTSKKKSAKQICVSKPLHKKHRTKKRHTQHKLKFHLIYSNENLKIYTRGKTLKIITDDTIIKDFRLKQPDRLVLDFGDDFVLYDTIRKTIRSPYIKMVKIGTHACFYRLTFVLAKNYRYRIKHLSNGYLITLR